MTESQRQHIAAQKRAFDYAFMSLKEDVAAIFPVGVRVRFYFAGRRQTGTITQAPYVWHNPASIWITTDKTKRVRRLDASNPDHKIEILP